MFLDCLMVTTLNRVFDHRVCLEDAKIIARKDHYQKREIREALEIIKHSHNLNKDSNIKISGSWFLLVKQISSIDTISQV